MKYCAVCNQSDESINQSIIQMVLNNKFDLNDDINHWISQVEAKELFENVQHYHSCKAQAEEYRITINQILEEKKSYNIYQTYDGDQGLTELNSNEENILDERILYEKKLVQYNEILQQKAILKQQLDKLRGKRKLLEEKQQAKELLEIQERRLTENIEIKKLLYEEMNTNIIPVKAKALLLARYKRVCKIFGMIKIETSLTNREFVSQQYQSNKRSDTNNTIIPIQSTQSKKFPRGTQFYRLSGVSTIQGIPLPNNGCFDSVHLDSALIAITNIVHLVDSVSRILNITLPHKLTTNDHYLGPTIQPNHSDSIMYSLFPIILQLPYHQYLHSQQKLKSHEQSQTSSDNNHHSTERKCVDKPYHDFINHSVKTVCQLITDNIEGKETNNQSKDSFDFSLSTVNSNFNEALLLLQADITILYTMACSWSHDILPDKQMLIQIPYPAEAMLLNLYDLQLKCTQIYEKLARECESSEMLAKTTPYKPSKEDGTANSSESDALFHEKAVEEIATILNKRDIYKLHRDDKNETLSGDFDMCGIQNHESIPNQEDNTSSVEDADYEWHLVSKPT